MDHDIITGLWDNNHNIFRLFSWSDIFPTKNIPFRDYKKEHVNKNCLEKIIAKKASEVQHVHMNDGINFPRDRVRACTHVIGDLIAGHPISVHIGQEQQGRPLSP